MKSLLLAPALLAVFASSAAASVTPPVPTGAAPVGFARATLTDTHRVEPLAGDTGPRRVPVRVWYPATARGTAPAHTLTAAEQVGWEGALGLSPGAFDGLGSAASANAPAARGSHPVLLMSPGRAEPSALMSASAADLASHGYVVVGVDVPGETIAVDRGDGTLVDLSPALDHASDESIALRSRDLRFVRSQLGGLKGVGRLDLQRVGAFGHSNGGATVADAMLYDRQIDAGVNLDGSMFGAVVMRGLDRPFAVVQGNETDEAYDSMREFYSHLRGPRRYVHVPNVRHHSFTDFVWLVPQLGADPVESEVGSVDPELMIAGQNLALRRFFDAYARA
jgi:predicted dienelactone hydrolase